ncbi:MAG: lipopolysaccharide biosynthesis protein RfbH [Acidobacteriia bacterium]|nr:lipopolysaccharide biosynthesis protein RfbH [Terriglobia bacterium]
MRASELRAEILRSVERYYDAAFPERGFQPGETPVPCAGRTFDSDELVCLVDSALDFWLTSGRYAARFEHAFARFTGVRHAMLCNSGSSANLLAVAALTSPKLGERRLQPGDEVITAAAAFPTTVFPLVQYGLVPVFVDAELGTYNANPDRIAEAITPRTRAIMLAHTLGNPFDLDRVLELAHQHDLWLIEDNCDALGSAWRGRRTGSFGHLATASFYPAHHITMGEGGCVLAGSPLLKSIVESFRDWGRDCWCKPGCDNTCGQRFAGQMGELPVGYDHKYTYAHAGYNLKLTDMQAAIGVAQLSKLPGFIETRKYNWRRLRDALAGLDEFLILPHASAHADPSWFGFAVTLREDAPFERRDLIDFLESRRIATRLLFAGNLTRQPALQGVNYRIAGELSATDVIMRRTFWVGVYPGLTEPMIDYVADSIRAFVHQADRVPAMVH